MIESVTFGTRLSAIIGEDITSTTVPSTTEAGYWIQDGVKAVVNNILVMNPAEALKFSQTTDDTSGGGVTVIGRVLSVVRQDGSAGQFRPASLMDAADRYEATDVESLKYRSKYNPGWYMLDGKVFTVPVTTSSDNKTSVTHLDYSTKESDPSSGSALDFNSEGILNFPNEYEYLVVLYAASFVCKAKANECHSLLPTLEELTALYEDINIPDLPRYAPPAIEFNLTDTKTQLTAEDLEMADKELELVTKKLEKFDKEADIASKKFDREMQIYTSKLDSTDKDKERQITSKIAIYKEKVIKYEKDIARITYKYGWWEAQATDLMNQFINGLRIAASPPPQQEEPKKGKRGE